MFHKADATESIKPLAQHAPFLSQHPPGNLHRDMIRHTMRHNTARESLEPLVLDVRVLDLTSLEYKFGKYPPFTLFTHQ